MLDKIGFAGYRAYLKAQKKLNDLKNREDGMETLETIILVAVAIVVAVLIVNFLTRNGFHTIDDKGKETTEETGVIGYIFSMLKYKLSTIFNAESVAEKKP
ncbi:MAG: hypothetical protein KBA55_07530 [Ruminococcus sp.]|nr:hypothetical protein [Ruminococcus sp.]